MMAYQMPTEQKSSLDEPPFREGDHVEKCKGYLWPGIVVSVFKTTKGEWRYVVECTAEAVKGALHIYNAEQLRAANNQDQTSNG